MFVIAEFSNDSYRDSVEIAIVPQNWMIKRDRRCYWPNNIGRKTFEELVRNLSPFKKSWPIYKVSNIYFKTREYSIPTSLSLL